MVVKLANNAVSSLAASITAGDTSLSIQVADAGKFPVLAEGQWHPATIIDAAGNMELVKVTARDGAALTIVRAQEGTTAKAFASGARIDVRFTAAVLAALGLVAFTGQYADLLGLPNLGTASDKDVGFFATAAQGQKADEAAPASALLDPWAFQPVGTLLACDAGWGGFVHPPRDKEYRYLLLSAGQRGSGAYNEDILSSEAVSGSSPTIVATGVVSLTGSPYNGLAVRLINTERRFLRAGSPGVVQDSLFAAHGHGVNDPGHVHGGVQNGTQSTGRSTSIDQPPAVYSRGNTAASGTGIWLSNSGGEETRSRNMGVDYYVRIK